VPFHAAEEEVRENLDQYPTPVDRAKQALLEINSDKIVDFGLSAFDPACGEGNLLEAAKSAFGMNAYGVEIDGSLVRKARDRGFFVQHGDAMEMEWVLGGHSVIIMNPPYSRAMDFVEKAVSTGLPTIALMRLSFLGSQSRSSFHRKNPSAVYGVSKRISFVKGKTDNTDSAWFVWNARGKGTWRVIE
jgi:predicted RNA methylase